MQPADRWKKELDDLVRRDRGGGDLGRAIRRWMPASVLGLPADLFDSLLDGLEGRLASDREGALAWLASLGSILHMDYDGTPLSPGDWEGLRQAFSDSGGEVDLELLTYVMGLALEKGYL